MKHTCKWVKSIEGVFEKGLLKVIQDEVLFLVGSHIYLEWLVLLRKNFKYGFCIGIAELLAEKKNIFDHRHRSFRK